MKDPIMDLDNIAKEVSDAIDEDHRSVRESEDAVEEKLEEEIEDAQREIDEGEPEEEEDLEEEEESLGEIGETLEAFKEGKVSDTVRNLAVRSLARHLRAKGRDVFAASLEDNNSDTDELIDIAKEEREKAIKSIKEKKTNKKEKHVATWKAIGRAAIKIRDLIKAHEKDEKGRVHLAWVALSEENRKHFELLTDEGDAEVQDVIRTASLVEKTLKTIHRFMSAELDYCKSNCTGDDAHLQYAAFIAEWADGRETLFEDNLLGGFNMRVVTDVSELEQGAIVKGPKFSVGSISVSNGLSDIDDEIEGDAREDKKYGNFVHGSLAAVASSVSKALSFYSEVETIDITLQSPRLALRLLRTVIALGIVLKDVGESNESENYVIERDDGNGSVVKEAEEEEQDEQSGGAAPADGEAVPDHF